MLPNAFITGGSGLLGLNILLHRPECYQFTALENKREIKLFNIKTTRTDLTNLKSIEDTLKFCKPKLIWHAAGMTNVDDCEKYPNKANLINGVFPGNVAKVSHELGVKFVYISTDQLFDGTKSFCEEKEDTNPVNEYGSSKALGEKLVLKYNPEAIIARCNFFGWGPSYKRSFSDFILDNLSKGKPIRLADDIFYTPALAQNLIGTIFDLVNRDASGIFNLAGSERLSKFEFGFKMAEIFGLKTSLINRVSWGSLRALAKRPSDMSLCSAKLLDFLGYDLGGAKENIIDLKKLIGKNLYSEVKNL